METSTRVDVARVIDDAKVSPFQRQLFVLLFILLMLDGFDTQSIAFVAPAITKAWGLQPAMFGPIFAAGLLGTVIGGVGFGMLADRIGRRLPIIVSFVIFGVFAGACAFATSYQTLIIYRVLAGLGLGGAMSNCLALASEYAPKRSRTAIVTACLWGFPFGAALGGLLAGDMIGRFGWPSVFYLGALLPLVCVPLLFVVLPESILFMTLAKQNFSERIARTLGRIDARQRDRKGVVYFIDEPALRRGSIKGVFSNGLASGTLLLWLTIFVSLVLVYCLINWIPTLLHQAGLSIQSAVLGTVVLNFSSILGSLVLTRVMKTNPMKITAVAYLLGAVAVAAIGLVGQQTFAIMAAIFATGFLVIGGQLTVTAFIASYYPTSIRSTGVGLAGAVARFGSLVGPLAGGLVLATSKEPSEMFMLFAVPALIASVALLAFTVIVGGRTRTAAAAASASDPVMARR
jgi:AAHS family 4-hydroxybenzoate transporter-like MFS transporter